MKCFLRLIAFFFFLMYALPALSQEHQPQEFSRERWHEGSIVLNDGAELKGFVRFNDKEDFVSYRDGDVARSYNAKRVAMFEFLDSLTNRKRTFYALEYRDTHADVIEPMFFELTKDFKTFAVLSRFGVIGTKTIYTAVNPASNPTPFTSNPTLSKRGEVIYFMNEQGDIEPYLQVDRGWNNVGKTKQKIVDKHILEKYFTNEEVKAMEKFARDNDLSFNFKEDFVKILDFCERFRDGDR